ncbi:energy-coupling factor ABC transporter permease [Chitinibacter tainanensis]|uniref:energy-coupling factor ABC transporter permease n=1 Tax=Chitinibacter tainanensis TaxID=230667 RepID=UPI002357DF10|nr:energy-coupling factor ABC transporter permease [Chitinibacter tainanensis]
MHIPNEMLQGALCPVTALLAVGGVTLAARAAYRARQQPGLGRFAAVAALIFAAQMLNFPVQLGTSGHLLGGVLAASLLGTPWAVLALTLVVSIQALVFADGGLLVLGANVLNMALLGAGVGGFLLQRLRGRGWPLWLAVPLAAWLSLQLAAVACALELALSGTLPLAQVLPAMLGVHMLIGVGEALLSVLLVALCSAELRARPRAPVALPALAAVLIATLLSPYASSYPDGLEWVLSRYGALHESAPLLVTPFADYSVAGLAEGALATGLAGLAGVLLVAGVALALGRLAQYWRRTASVF